MATKNERRWSKAEVAAFKASLPAGGEPRGGLTHERWLGLTAVEKLQALYGQSLDACYEVLFDWGADLKGLPEPHLNMFDRVRRDVMMIAARFAITASLTDVRERGLADLAERVSAAAAKKRD